MDGVAVDLAPRGACTGRGMFASWKKTTSDGSSVLHTGIMLRLVGGGCGCGGGEGNIMGGCGGGLEEGWGASVHLASLGFVWIHLNSLECT